jgi:hypothetical protein
VDRPPNTKSANDYSPALSGTDSHVMTHATGNVTYHATRFDSTWAPDRENPVSKAIDRATVGSTIKLPHGIAIDCAGGPSSPGGLDTTVPVVALASAGCHGSPPLVAIDARAVLDIQMLAPATPLADSGKPPIASSSAPGDAAKDAACLEPRVAGAPPLDCARITTLDATRSCCRTHPLHRSVERDDASNLPGARTAQRVPQLVHRPAISMHRHTYLRKSSVNGKFGLRSAGCAPMVPGVCPMRKKRVRRRLSAA